MMVDGEGFGHKHVISRRTNLPPSVLCFFLEIQKGRSWKVPQLYPRDALCQDMQGMEKALER